MTSLQGILFAGLILNFCAILPAAAGAPAGPTNADCLGCHADKGLSKAVKGKKVSLYTDERTLTASVHGSLACTDCHADITEVPHPEKLAPVACGSCHPDAPEAVGRSVHGRKGGPELDCQSCHGAHDVKRVTQVGTTLCETCHQPTVSGWRAGVHGQAAAQGVGEAARCRDCHGPSHEVASQHDPGAPTSRVKMAETCGRCHADRALIEKRQIPVPQAFQLFQKSVHGRAVAAGKAAATCNTCHASHEIRRAGDPKSSVHRQNIAATCGACHASETAIYLESIHGTAVRRGATKAPVCTDCHGEHSISAAQDPNSRVSAAQVTKTCSTCHAALEIAEKYGLPDNRVATYQDSFHGLAARGGSLTAANCASCHGFHDVRPSTDPKSSVHPSNLPATCGQCHPGASENFARGSVHLSVTREEAPLLYYVRTFYLLLIAATIGGMAAHNGLDFLKKLRRTYRRWLAVGPGEVAHVVEPEGTVLRMSLAERWQHALLGSSFIVLVYTGFALKFPDTWLFAWLVALEQGSALRGWAHRGAALVMILACLWHIAYLTTRRGRGLVADMRPRAEDAREAWQNIRYLAGRRSDPPRFDRFSYIEKAEYWSLIWGSIIMIVTGLILWFETAAMRVMPLWFLDLATIIHYYEAWLATLAIVVWHFYMVIFNPDVYPMNWTWLTGRISTAMLRHEHPREYERLYGDAGPGPDSGEPPNAAPGAEPPDSQPA